MDNSVVEWSTPTSAIALLGISGVALAVCAVAIPTDPPGRALVGLAAIGLLVMTVIRARQRPRLALLPGRRLAVRGVYRNTVYTQDDVRQARIVRYPRLGRRIPMLEVDVAHGDSDRLLIFSKWDLGTHPDDVLDALVANGMARRPT
ncbi:PH domain-containing protein [Antrihabitans stalagmiti]|uniref:PH domain-containing protein n=1 Tax=Antrihabitans stalagmiti TaxID=2799499 RepID=UPI0027DDFB60|nr:PH domain-containing protein [Antrihabitans stalagmiti]